MENKPRDVWAAGLLSLIQPGLGQVYNGELKKAFLIYALPFFIIPAKIICLYSNYIKFFLVAYVIICMAFYIYVFIDAVKTAKKFSVEYHLKKYNKTIFYIGIATLVAILSFTVSTVVKFNIIKAYKIPSTTMEPTILKGDHILVDRTQSAKNPQKNDVIVFKYFNNPSKDLVKRVVAIGGETVEIRNKQLIINGNPVKESYVTYHDAVIYPASQQPRDNFGPIVIPADFYFVLGDNRDESLDSRFFGPVEKTKIQGTVKFIYWSWYKEKQVVRWDRIGLKVQ
ncbi:MAG: signal peptidase I [Deltaproteobacteria bacterium]|nr:signal peptidase I [Deltaproteobacteria bacterium]